MTYKEMIQEIKETIKSLTVEQIEAKKELRQPHNDETWETMSEAFFRGIQITIYLNFYNEIRGKEYRHSTRKYADWFIGKAQNELKKYESVIQESQVVNVA